MTDTALSRYAQSLPRSSHFDLRISRFPFIDENVVLDVPSIFKEHLLWTFGLLTKRAIHIGSCSRITKKYSGTFKIKEIKYIDFQIRFVCVNQEQYYNILDNSSLKSTTICPVCRGISEYTTHQEEATSICIGCLEIIKKGLTP